jgi:hypothetical protein
MPYDEEKGKNREDLWELWSFNFILCPKSSVLSRGCIEWVGEVQIIENISKPKFPEKSNISEFLTGFQRHLWDISAPA